MLVTLRSLPVRARSPTLSHQLTISILRGQNFVPALCVPICSSRVRKVNPLHLREMSLIQRPYIHPPPPQFSSLTWLQALPQNHPGPFLLDGNVHTDAGAEREQRASCSVREVQAQHPGIYFDRRAMQKPLSHFLSTHLHSHYSLPPPLFGCLQRHRTPDTSDRN